jgi:peptidylprolyl isomerase/peptidyl-prolyl cis-trans isomerase B (cyclophilin B)
VPDSRAATGGVKPRPVRSRRRRSQDRTMWIALGAVLVLIAVTAAVVLLQQQQAAQPAATETPLASLQVETAAPGAATASSGTPEASGDRPLAARAPADRNSAFSAPPEMTIDTGKSYQATIKTEVGDIVVNLFADQAPKTVNSFVFLARQGFYDNVTFHRVLDGFMAQGGDPTGTGTGGPGYQFENENQDATFDKAGQLAMANAGPNTNGSQFFITFGPTQLSGADYTIFGEVVQGLDVLDQIKRRDPNTNPSFTGTVINRIDISEG